MSVAMPHLIFASLLWSAGLAFWLTDRKWPWAETAAAIPAVILAGLGAGILLGAWT